MPSPSGLVVIAGILTIAAAVYAVMRQVEVRLALGVAALALSLLAGDPLSVVRTFFATLAREQFVVPICCAMGFAYVLKHTGCDQHLVHLLTQPLRRARTLLIPGAVLVGFCVNIPVISQTSTAVAIGSVLVPLMQAARISPTTIGASLLLGSSLGGELLNPGAPELNTIADALKTDPALCVEHVFPLLIVQLAVATGLFWVLSLRAEATASGGRKPPDVETITATSNERRQAAVESSRQDVGSNQGADAPRSPGGFRVNLIKAAIPLLPLLLLFLTGPPLQLIEVPKEWLVKANNPADLGNFPPRLIGAAMLVGVVAAAIASRGTSGGIAKAFFQGAGYAFANIISLIVIANCFGEGVRLIGFDAYIGKAIDALPTLLLPMAGLLPLGFAFVCGSGMAATQSLYAFFVQPAQSVGVNPLHVGAVVSISAAAGRTMSPVAAVTLMSANLTESNPLEVAKRVALPLLAGIIAVQIAAIIIM
jgi:C4-dicarboxylate transporter, DcuC family